MSIYIYGQPSKQSIDQPGMVANPSCGQLNGENVVFFLLQRGAFDSPNT